MQRLSHSRSPSPTRQPTDPSGAHGTALPSAKPGLLTHWRFDPVHHTVLDATGLSISPAIFSDPAVTASDIAELANEAHRYISTPPLLCPLGFNPGRHVKQAPGGQWVPDAAAICGDTELSEIDKREVFRWVRAHPDPAALQRSERITNCITLGCAALVAGVIFVAVVTALSVPGDRAATGHYQFINRTEAQALLDELLAHVHDPRLANATLDNYADWFDALPTEWRMKLPLPTADGTFAQWIANAAPALADVREALWLLALGIALQFAWQG
jgi:hypothetical protein